MPIVSVYGQDIDFGDLQGEELQSAVASAAEQLAPKPQQPRQQKSPQKPLPSPGEAALQGAKRGLFSLGAGLVRGAGSIGSTIIAPGDMLADALLGDENRNDKRRSGIDRGLASLTGADVDSFGYKAGKLTGEVAGTAGIGPAIGAALLKTGSAAVAPLAEAVATGGFRAGGAGIPTRIAGGGISGGAAAGLVDPDNIPQGTAAGALLPPAVLAAGKAGDAVRRALYGQDVPDDVRRAIEKAVEAGYVIPPSQAKPTLFNRAVEGVAGKLTTAQNASARNADVTSSLASRAVGLPEDAKLTPEVLNQVRAQAGKAYDAIGKSGIVVPTSEYDDALNAIVEPYVKAAAGFPGAKPPAIVDDIESLRTTQFDAEAGIAKIKELRAMADKAGAGGDKATASAYKKAATAIEDAIDRHLIDIQAPAEMIDAFRQARQLIAKTYTVEKAINPTTGSIDARKIGAELRKGRPLTGGLKTIGDFANRFPKAAQPVENMGSLPQTSPLDWASFGTMSALTSQPLLMTGVMARPAARALALSPVVQNGLAKPSRDSIVRALLNDEQMMPLLMRAVPVASSSR